MNAPKLWPVKGTTAFRLLRDLINGHGIWVPLATPPARIKEFDGAILGLRLLGWPVISKQNPSTATGLAYELPDQTRLDAAAEVKRRLAEMKEHTNGR